MLNNIQALRFFAAFAVVLFHSRKLFEQLGLQADAFLAVASYGSAGVDVFFVISGFVMWHATQGGGQGPRVTAEFARRRLFRIYLGYWPCYAIAAAVVIGLGERDLGKIYWVTDFFLLNPTIQNQLLGVAWTLSFELYFYAIFSLLILLKEEYRRWLLLAGLLGVAVVHYVPPVQETPFPFILSPFLIEFFGGSLVAAFLGSSRSHGLLLFAVVMVVVMTIYALGLPRAVPARVQGFGVAAIFLVLAVVILENAGIWVAGRRLVFLGNTSYAIYLLHTVLFWVLYSLLDWFGEEMDLIYGLIVYFGTLALVLVVSALNYVYVEAPLYKYALRNWFPRLGLQKKI